MSTKPTFPCAVLLAAIMALSLSACGAGTDYDSYPATQTSTTGVTEVPANVTAVPSVHAVSANMPAPDCAPENCSSLRIIDGNAEAWRADAAKRAASAADSFAG